MGQIVSLSLSLSLSLFGENPFGEYEIHFSFSQEFLHAFSRFAFEDADLTAYDCLLAATAGCGRRDQASVCRPTAWAGDGPLLTGTVGDMSFHLLKLCAFRFDCWVTGNLLLGLGKWKHGAIAQSGPNPNSIWRLSFRPLFFAVPSLVFGGWFSYDNVKEVLQTQIAHTWKYSGQRHAQTLDTRKDWTHPIQRMLKLT